MKGLLIALALVAFLYFGFVDDSLLQFGHASPVTHTVQKAAVASDMRWNVLWWSLVGIVAIVPAVVGMGLILALISSPFAIYRFFIVPAKNARERVDYNEVTGLAPIIREDKSTWIQRIRGIRDVVEHDPNLAIAPTRKIYANGHLDVQADLHGFTQEQQASHAMRSWNVQGVVAASGKRANQATMRAAAGVYEQEAELKRLKVVNEERRQLAPVEHRLQLPDTQQGEVVALSARAGFFDNTSTRLAMGANRSGKAVVWDVESAPHIRVHGKSQGSGKTNTIATIVCGALRAGAHVILLDRRSFKDWSQFLPYVEAIDNTKPGAFAGTVKQICAIYQERDQVLGAAGVGNIGQLDSAPQRIFVVISEFGTACREADATGQLEAVVTALKSIMSEAAATGIHMIYEDQVVNRNWPRELRGNAEPVTGYLPEDTVRAGGYGKAHELDRHEFHYEGERFKTWDMKVEAPKLLTMATPLADEDRVIDVRSFVRSQDDAGSERERAEKPVFSANEGTKERENTDLQAAVWAWRDANPTSESQADMRRALDGRGMSISKGYSHACWHAWPGVTPAGVQPSPMPTLGDLLAQHGEVYVHGQRVTMAVDKTQEFRPG